MDEVVEWFDLAENAVTEGVPIYVGFDLISTVYLCVGLFVAFLSAYVLGNIILKSL